MFLRFLESYRLNSGQQCSEEISTAADVEDRSLNVHCLSSDQSCVHDKLSLNSCPFQRPHTPFLVLCESSLIAPPASKQFFQFGQRKRTEIIELVFGHSQLPTAVTAAPEKTSPPNDDSITPPPIILLVPTWLTELSSRLSSQELSALPTSTTLEPPSTVGRGMPPPILCPSQMRTMRQQGTRTARRVLVSLHSHRVCWLWLLHGRRLFPHHLLVS